MEAAKELVNKSQNILSKDFVDIRNNTKKICEPLQIEDYVAQPVTDVSPPKWHLAHTTWFFEAFFLPKVNPEYKPFDESFGYLFNSYYETVGDHALRTHRGFYTRPGVDRIYEYRKYVDQHVVQALEQVEVSDELKKILVLGLHHEMQHQELLYYDFKYILGHNPLFPVYDESCKVDIVQKDEACDFISVKEGVYEVGFSGSGFSYDNERNRHKVYIRDFEIATRPVLFGEFIEFIEDGGYQSVRLWHSDAWIWVNQNGIEAPLYMHKQNNEWYRYSLSGYKPVNPLDVLIHISFYEAAAFAAWKGMRLPTEFEWEVAASHFKWGDCWEWTNSAYLPYPGFKAAPGPEGEYNGKFMVNQMVLKGASKATPHNHSRITYRNFFHPHLRWQYAGVRLVK